ncbi:MAG TPA: M12 family metallopeptidase [Puia sp.]|nr:M12 family metallopeptidase [Puia sp.]
MPNTNYVTKRLCNQPKPIVQQLPPGIDGKRAFYILSNNKKWVNGTQIKYMFIEGSKPQWDVVRKAFQQWMDLGIGLSFTETDQVDESMVRIGFDQTDGSWSYVGRDILTIAKPERTMNFGWDLTADSYGLTTALHEIGHTIGFQHEHQSPFAGIVWNTDAVYKEFSGPPNSWPKDQIDSNIINKIPPNQVTGSNWDPTSIMEYEFGPGLVVEPAEYKAGIFPPGVLSSFDIAGVKSFYPDMTTSSLVNLKVMQSTPIAATSGGQANFTFTPPVTRKYTFQTFGEMDTVMVVSEKGDKENHYLSGDDDSGAEKNTKIGLPLVKDREYLVNVRVLFSPTENSGGIVVF